MPAAVVATPIAISLLSFLSLLSLVFVQCDVQVPSINATYPEHIASFGPRLAEPDGLAGYMIPIESLYSAKDTGKFRKACHALSPPRHFHAPWIALVERGACSFVDKVRAMQQSGAAAVIVGDSYPSGPLITMYAAGDTSDVAIPSVFVARWESDMLRALALQNVSLDQSNPHLWVRITPNEPIFQELSMLSLLLLAILAPCALLFVIYTLWQWRSGEVNALRAAHVRQHDASMRAASPEMVARLSKVPYVPDHRDPDSDMDDASSAQLDLCAICLESFMAHESLRQLPCGHLFHIPCVDPWLLTRRRTCPICKGDIGLPSLSTADPLSDSEEAFSESEPLLQRAIDIQALNIQRYLQMSRSGSIQHLRSCISLIPRPTLSAAPAPLSLSSDGSFVSASGSAAPASQEDFEECVN